MQNFFETHTHLDYLKTIPTEDTLRLCEEQGVRKILTISVDQNNQETVINIARQYPQVFCTQGMHPHHAKDITSEILELIKDNAQQEKKVLAIGEIGLDYHYDYSPRPIQIDMFEKQLQIASDLAMPVVIHTREADEDMLSILKNSAKSLPRKGVIHSYSSGPELAEFALSEGFYLGFNGMVTFKKSENVRDIVRLCPPDRILFETDSPFLAPDPYRGKENSSYYVPIIAKKIAQIKELNEDKFFDLVFSNTEKLFFR